MLTFCTDMLRLARAGFVLTREGVVSACMPARLPAVPRAALRMLCAVVERRRVQNAGRAQRLTRALTRLGPSWMKLGQFLSTRPDVVGKDLAHDLEHLQDQAPPFTQTEAVHALEKSLGQPVEHLFASFSAPVAAASIAQVHKAVITNSTATQTVAVKILRPGIVARFQRDMRAFARFARLAEKAVPALRRLKPAAVVATLARSIAVELDLRLEGAALVELAQNTKNDEGFTVPAVAWERTAHDVLTTAWVDGIPLHATARLRAAGHDLADVARLLMQNFLRQALRDGFFHADLHPGNVFVNAQGKLVAVDGGIMGRLSFDERRFLAEILYSFITRDYRRGARVHFEAGYVPADQSVALFSQALRAIGEPIFDRPASEMSMARVMAQLFDYTGLFNMQTREELLLLQKTMAVVEGVARQLDPDFHIWNTARPVVEHWVGQHLNPAAQFKRGVERFHAGLNAWRDVPQQLSVLAKKLETNRPLCLARGWLWVVGALAVALVLQAWRGGL